MNLIVQAIDRAISAVLEPAFADQPESENVIKIKVRDELGNTKRIIGVILHR